MRIAIIADIHGNLTALDRVLSEIEAEGLTECVCLGDVAGLGPCPREALHRLRELACPVVMGNADEFLLDPSLLDPHRHPGADENLRRMHDIERWCAGSLDEEDRAFIRTFRPTVELRLDGGETLLCYHGSPRSPWEHVEVSASEADLEERLGPSRCRVMAGGHTHEQFVRRWGESVVLNAGSVGLAYEATAGNAPRNPPWAEYAIVTSNGDALRVELRRVALDAREQHDAVLRSGMPHAAWWAAYRH